MPALGARPLLFTLGAMDSRGPIPYLCPRRSLGVHKGGIVSLQSVAVSGGNTLPSAPVTLHAGLLYLCFLLATAFGIPIKAHHHHHLHDCAQRTRDGGRL